MMNTKDFFLNFRRIGIAATLAAIVIIFAGCADGNSGGSSTNAEEIRVEIDAQNLRLIDNGQNMVEITIRTAPALNTIAGLGNADTITVPIEISGNAASRVQINEDGGGFTTPTEGNYLITIAAGTMSKTIALRVHSDGASNTVNDSFTVRIGTLTPAGKLAVTDDYTIKVMGTSGTTLLNNKDLIVTVIDSDRPSVSARFNPASLEEGTTGSLELTLNNPPNEDVTVTAEVGNEVPLTLNGAKMVTTTLNIATPTLSIPIESAENNQDEADAAYPITITASEGAEVVNPMPILTVIDNDTDTDGDGIADISDKCQNVGSTAGWTSTAETDADRDGCRDRDEDIDDDNDGLIEIRTLAQLNNMRYNTAGTSYKESSTAAAVITGAPTTPTTNCKEAVNMVYLCGYELMNNLDFDTDGDGASFTVETTTPQITATGDAQDAYYNGGSGWDPICTGSCTAFTGIFEGNEHTISNLYINYNGTAQNGTGLFGKASGQIQNVRLAKIYVQNMVSGDRNVGGLVGNGTGSTIVNSHGAGIVQGAKDSTSENVGGLVGSGNTITSSQFQGSVIGGISVGGLSGVTAGTVMGNNVTGSINNIILGITVGGLVGTQTSGIIQASYAAINVNGSDVTTTTSSNGNVGGLVGRQSSGTIAASYASGSVNGGAGAHNVGGLVGLKVTGNLFANYASGSANGGADNDNVGGLVGHQQGGNIIANYATGLMEGGPGNDAVGGLLGYQQAGELTATYSTGQVNGGADDDNVGGLIGRKEASSHVIASYTIGNVDGGAGTDTGGTLAGPHGGNPFEFTTTYGFGTIENEETTIETPGRITSVSELRTRATGWNNTTGSFYAWDFGTGSEIPALLFAEYDGSGGTNYCGAMGIIPSKFADGSAITCSISSANGSLIPGQRE